MTSQKNEIIIIQIILLFVRYLDWFQDSNSQLLLRPGLWEKMKETISNFDIIKMFSHTFYPRTIRAKGKATFEIQRKLYPGIDEQFASDRSAELPVFNTS
jgi:CRISPR/Cas system-associated endoribonuclease Cas2